MKKILSIILAMVLSLCILAGCDTKIEDQNKEQNANIISPLPETLDINTLDNCTVAISLKNGGAYVNDVGKMVMDVTVYSYELYDMVDIASLKENDVILRKNEEVKVTEFERLESGLVRINGGEENGGFFYEINSDLSFGNIKISYKNGEQTVSAFGIDQTMEYTEENAKADINDFMMNIKYNPKHIFNLQKYAEGVYELDFHTTNYVDLADYDYLFAAYDGYADYISSLNMKITVKDGSIVKIENSIEALGKYGDNRSVNVDIVYSIAIMK